MLSGQSGLFPLLPWSRLPLSCGCHQCSWWSWSCHAWCCVANVAATWQLQLQNDHVFFTGFYPFWAIYGCYRHWLLNGNGPILKFWAPEWETFCSSRCLHHSSCWGILVQCLAQHPKHLWRWVIVRVQVSERAVSSVCVFVLFVAYKDFLLHLFHLRFFCFDCLDPRSLIHFGAIMISRYCRQGFECFWRWGHFSGMWPQSGANGNLLTMTINENLACNDIYQDLSYIHVRHVAVVNPSCPGGQANERWLCPSSRRDGQFGTNTSCDQM